MLTLTRKTDYALVALAYLAQQRHNAGTVSARRVADQFGLPLPLLMNILKELAAAGIVSSTRGAQGGYALAADAREITLYDVVTALEGPLRLAPCLGEGHNPPMMENPGIAPSCRLLEECPVHGSIRRLHERIHDFLRTVSLADLLDSEVDVPLTRVGNCG